MGNAKSSESTSNAECRDENTVPILTVPDSGAKKSSTSSEMRKKKSAETSATEPKTKSAILNSGQRQIVKFCMDNAKDDLGERIFRRVSDKREDFRAYLDNVSKSDRSELVESLRQFVLRVVEVIMEPDELDTVCRSFGERHAHLRGIGFKPDFFAGIADAMTTECVFLDGATHAATETLIAWSQLTSVIFSAVRDGFYAELRRLRRVSNGTSATNSSTKDSDETAEREPSREPSREPVKEREEPEEPNNFPVPTEPEAPIETENQKSVFSVQNGVSRSTDRESSREKSADRTAELQTEPKTEQFLSPPPF